MRVTTYYNEHNSCAAQWLRELTRFEDIAPGFVDDRDIQQVTPDDVRDYDRCHFFAGIGGWDYACSLAGWDGPIWTASLPCQPFSTAGKQRGTDDERHLWPVFRKLIATCNPRVIVGEQVASKAGREWLSNVRFDLEHIRFWGGFYENLHEVRGKAAEGKFSEICWEVCRRVASDLQVVPAEIRKNLEQQEQRSEESRSAEASREREDLQGKVRRGESGRLARWSSQEEESGKRYGLQPRPIHSRDRTADSQWLRNDWLGVQSICGEEEQLELAFDRQGRPGKGLCVQQHPDNLFRDECGSWELGRRQFADLDVRMAEQVNDEQRLAEGFGEVLASKPGRAWLASVQADLEALGYAVVAADLCAAGVGAPHIRQRLYWGAVRVGDGNVTGLERRGVLPERADQLPAGAASMADGRGLADTGSERRQQIAGSAPANEAAHGGAGWDRGEQNSHHVVASDGKDGAWSSVHYLPCADGKTRPIEPGLEPLAHGVSGRVELLRGYGNAIVPQVAAAFLTSLRESL